MKNKKQLLVVFSVFLLSLTLSAVALADMGESHFNGENMSMNGTMSFDSGSEFAEHVVAHHGMFNGTMNPGVHHRGYSPFVR